MQNYILVQQIQYISHLIIKFIPYVYFFVFETFLFGISKKCLHFINTSVTSSKNIAYNYRLFVIDSYITIFKFCQMQNIIFVSW